MVFNETTVKVHDRRYFVLFHLLAWMVYAAVYYEEVIRYQKPADYWQIVLVAAVSGSLLCWCMALVYLRVRHRNLLVKSMTAIGASLLAALAWVAVRNIFFDYVYAPADVSRPLLDLGGVFRGVNALLFWSALYFVYDNYKIAKQNQIQTLTAQSLARDNQLKLLSYQLNPHFLFNVLNSIATMVLKHDSKAAHDTIVKLSDFLRYTLYSEPWRKVTLEQELKCAGQYLEIQMVRFQDRLQVNYDVPKELHKTKVPNLILQPIIENAIKHTITDSAGSVQIAIKAAVEGNNLKVTVLNNLPSAPPTKQDNAENSQGWGLANVRERLQAYYAGNAALEIERQAEGYGVTLFIPYEVQEAKE
ncbi:MAG: histidine kinase [Gammaproteobacteria bacterium]|nr:histidine kinase [Gammaproteobacteria bacterium]